MNGTELKIQLPNSVLSISIGQKTDWFEQVPEIMISEEFYNEDKEIEYAVHIYSYKGPKLLDND